MGKQHRRAIVWLRRDLRLQDHGPLSNATKMAQEVFLVFVFDPGILAKLESRDDPRLTFIWESLLCLRSALENGPEKLLICHGPPDQVIPQLAAQIQAEAVYAGDDYEPETRARDERVAQALQVNKRQLHLIKDQVIFHKNEVLNQSGLPFKVFTPYKKAWLNQLAATSLPLYQTRIERIGTWPAIPHLNRIDHLKQLGFQQVRKNSPEEAGEKGAQKRFKDFLPLMTSYHKQRDFPAIDGCSHLSIHLRFGTISVRQLVDAAIHKGTQGADTWLSELIWREFYKSILYHFPYVTRGCFQQKYDGLRWRGKEAHFQKWLAGETGFPLVDAALREFAQTGRMHNRLRMVVAHFLTKDLLVHWQKGEAYFAQKLLDFDLSANNGGWQWSSSVGCDAQPYFRVFNPWSQSLRFDPQGAYIKKHLPSLTKVPAKALHDPKLFEHERPRTYPKPLVDHKAMRLQAIDMFKDIKP